MFPDSLQFFKLQFPQIRTYELIADVLRDVHARLDSIGAFEPDIM